MKNKGKHESDKAQRKNYKLEDRHGKNKLRRLNRQLKQQPNNLALAKRIEELEISVLQVNKHTNVFTYCILRLNILNDKST